MEKIVEIIRDKGYKVELKDVNKNGVIKKAIAISPKDSAMAPVLYLDHYDFDGNTDEETADFLIDIAKRHFADLSIDAEGLITWTNALKNLRVGLRTIALDTYGDGLVTRRRFDMEEYLCEMLYYYSLVLFLILDFQLFQKVLRSSLNFIAIPPSPVSKAYAKTLCLASWYFFFISFI